MLEKRFKVVIVLSQNVNVLSQKLVLAHSFPIFWLFLSYPLLNLLSPVLYLGRDLFGFWRFYLHPPSWRNSRPLIQVGMEHEEKAWSKWSCKPLETFREEGNGWPGFHQERLQSPLSYLEVKARQMLIPLWRGTELGFKDEPLGKGPIWMSLEAHSKLLECQMSLY